MKCINGNLIFFLFFMLTLSVEASAYIDPGTGGAIIGSLGPIVAALFALIGVLILKYLISPIKKLASKCKDLLRGSKG